MKKLQGLLTDEVDCVLAMSLRLAALFYRNRSEDIFVPAESLLLQPMDIQSR